MKSFTTSGILHFSNDLLEGDDEKREYFGREERMKKEYKLEKRSIESNQHPIVYFEG